MGNGEFSPGLKLPWHEADHSPQVHDGVKNEWMRISPHLIHTFRHEQGQFYLFTNCMEMSSEACDR